MSSYFDILDALADQISTGIDATANQIQVQPRLIWNATPPTIDIFPADQARDPETAAMGDIDGGYLLTVRARATTVDNIAGQDLLIAFMDDENTLSVPAAILDDPTLNGYAATLHVLPGSGFREYPSANGDGALLGCQWDVLVVGADS